MNLTFTIPGEPTAQGRPRFSTHGGFVKAYDPETSRNYKAYVKFLASEAMQRIGLTLTELPLEVEIIADVGIPASKSKKFKEQALNGLQLPIKKPMLTTLQKLFLILYLALSTRMTNRLLNLQFLKNIVIRQKLR